MEFRNPRFNARGTVDVEVNHPKYGWIPFTADPNDPEEHGRALYGQLIENPSAIAAYEPPPPPSLEEVAASVREERDARLKRSDWTQLPDVPPATREAWAAYRQALRDVPEQPGFPTDVVWPESP